ncbi:MAG: hypothetical protein ABJX32_21005 [Tateyamaria sp.]|uniref:hypothetical protein n=1 Tax=Tateyamaria sp. TaxID=1929288 RepID=UPI00329D9256
MNANQIINLVVRIVMRKAINGGINAGMRKVSGVRGAQPAPRPQPQHTQAPPAPQAELGPNDAKIQRKLAAKRAARAAKAATRTNTG